MFIASMARREQTAKKGLLDTVTPEVQKTK
jgi:hypothetical protein